MSAVHRTAFVPPFRFDFQSCEIRADSYERAIRVIFRDGSEHKLIPEDYAAAAVTAGYGLNVWAYCLHRALFQTWLAQCCGLQYSHTLYDLAHGAEPDPTGREYEEKQVVQFLAKFIAASVAG